MHTALDGLSPGSLPTPPFPLQGIEVDIDILTYVHNVNGNDSFIDSPSPPTFPQTMFLAPQEFLLYYLKSIPITP